MIYETTITIPANTTKASPKSVRLPVDKGIITRFNIQIPPGHADLAHLTIYDGIHPIAPSIEGMTIHGDNILLTWDDYYEFFQPPYELVLLGYNDDDTYEHSFIVYVTILPKWVLAPFAFLEAIKSLFGKLAPTRLMGGSR